MKIDSLILSLKKPFKFLVAAAILACLVQSTAQAQILFSFSTSGNPNPLTPTGVDPNATVTNFTASSPFSQAGSDKSGIYNGTRGSYGAELDNSNFDGTLAGAVSDGVYFTFTVTPNSGFAVNATSLDLSALSLEGEGSYTFVLESSATGFGSGAGNILATFTPEGYGASSGTYATDVTLDPTDFSNVTSPLEFRLYVFTASGTVGNRYDQVGISGSFALDGSIDLVAAPEPSTYALLGSGLLTLVILARRKAAEQASRPLS